MKQITIIEQATLEQFTLYDNSADSILRKFEGFEYPDVRASIDDVSGIYGSVYINSKYGSRRFSIEGDLVGSNIFAQRRNLLKALKQTGVMKLIKFTTYDDLQLQCEAEVVKLVNPYTHSVHTFMIDFIAPDWRFYTQSVTAQSIPQTALSGGFSIPATIPLSLTLATGGITANNILDNQGNETTDPVFTIIGPGNNFIIQNAKTGKQFIYTDVLVEGDSVVIDVKNRTVIKNGTDNAYQFISGDLWSIEAGENEYRFFVTSGGDINSALQIDFQNAYSGV